jgi:hypothetical protein
MLKAIVKQGAIVPLEPLPPEWRDGTPVHVEADDEVALSPEDSKRLAREADESYREVEEAAAQLDPRDADIIDAAIQEMDRIAKDQVRREMGLP